MSTRYVAGFAFDREAGLVALIRKARPEWQAGRLNAIGGHIEPGERPHDAMVREFEEETGARIPWWDHFATVSGDWGCVYFYRTDVPGLLDRVSTTTDEPVECYRVSELGSVPDTLPNLSWLIPLALYRHDIYEPLIAMEV